MAFRPIQSLVSGPERTGDARILRHRMLVLAALIFAFLLEVTARQLHANQRPVASELLSLLAMFSLVAPALLLIMRLQLEGFLRWTLTLSALGLLAAQGLNLASELRAPAWLTPLLGPVHSNLEWTLAILSLLLMLAALYGALIETSATKMRLAAERAELAEEVRQRREISQALQARMAHQAALNDLGHFALGCGTAAELLARAAHAISMGLKMHRSAVWQLRQEHELLLGFGEGWPPGMVGQLRIPRVAQENRPATLESSVAREALGQQGLMEELSTPFGRHGRSQGVLSAYSEVPKAFSADEWNFLESVSHMVTVTLERLHAEELLAKNERYFRAITDHALDLVTVLNPDGTIRYESPSIRNVLGYAPEERQGQTVLSVVHPEDVARVLAHFTQGLEKPEEPRVMLLRCRHKDGSWRTLEAIGRNLISDPEIQGAIINSRDVTERTQLEQQLLQAQKMEGIGRLAGGVAHDFNNLLTAIVGYKELLSASIAPETKASGYLEQIGLAAARAGTLTRQLLAFARKQIVEPRYVSMSELILGLEEMLRRLIGEDVALKCYPRSSGSVLADPGQIEQVVINLIVNARDAMPQGGAIILETLDQELDEEFARHHPGVKPGRYMMLAVTDTGVGMTPEVRARIFEPFFTTKAPGKGTGLGLATSYGIVRQAEGHIWVYSEPQQGATFKVYLPRVDAPPEPVIAEDPGDPKAGSETILLVEDDSLVRDITTEILLELGYTVLQAESPVQAVSLSMEQPGDIHLLLTDVVMPGMGGRQLAQVLREHRPSMGVLYMSGYTGDAIVQLGALDDGVHFISKPFTPAALSRSLRSILDQSPALL